MRRVAFTPRPYWRQQCEELGFTFHSIGGTYWDESAAYQMVWTPPPGSGSTTVSLSC